MMSSVWFAWVAHVSVAYAELGSYCRRNADRCFVMEETTCNVRVKIV